MLPLNTTKISTDLNEIDETIDENNNTSSQISRQVENHRFYENKLGSNIRKQAKSVQDEGGDQTNALENSIQHN